MFVKKVLSVFLMLMLAFNVYAKKITVGIVIDSTLGDGSFNDITYKGMRKAKKELGVKLVLKQPKSQHADAKEREAQVEDLVKQSVDLIILNGFTFEALVRKMAAKYPNQKFVHNDGDVKNLPNVLVSRFKEDEGSFLAGYLAAKVSKTGTIGFIGGVDVALIHKFYKGYEQGAKKANPSIVISKEYIAPAGDFSGFSNPRKANKLARKMYGQKADIIYAVAGLSGNGVINAAKSMKKYAIGVDTNQDSMAKGTVITSMMKRLDVTTYNVIKNLTNGKFTGGTVSNGLKEKGVSLTDMKFSGSVIPAALKKEVSDIKKKLIDGTITIK